MIKKFPIFIKGSGHEFICMRAKDVFTISFQFNIFKKMSLPMRITFEGEDYTYMILTKMINKETNEIRISLNGEELTLSRNARGEWDAVERTVSDRHGLLMSIARNVALRYRL
ncbi:hypothetical protein [Pedobacter roseus]|uniref:Uncharacterized protein n=1 Tax=Pedobacter roseus TaxID=336820 RepID=A0A7G9QHV6_9SPHI|nr:hypothetical protein [Pedobacter roseus]QNN42931.1 hypothetical protein H9L23_02150 [Pedobacter roseus]